VARCAAVAHSSATRRVRSAAFSLIELLVVIAIIGVLLGLLVPAVQASREASRKTVCGNNLRQAGLAMQAHATSHGAYPAGYVSKVKPNGDDAGPGWAWGSKLLPMMEQREVFEQIDFESPVESPASEAVRMTSLPVFICPSDSGFERVIDIKRHAAFKV